MLIGNDAGFINPAYGLIALWALKYGAMKNEMNSSYIIDMENLPEKFPTHEHEPAFFESLGRAVATYGFLEEILTKAIFALTATRRYRKDELPKAYENWVKQMERTISDSLGRLINSYKKSLKEHPDVKYTDYYDQFVTQLKDAKPIRDAICHGSWGVPNKNGASIPFFVNKKQEIFTTEIDIKFLDRVQNHVKELACEVINSVTEIDLQFPSANNGPGKPIW